MNNNIIFIGGIHGVGKGTICEEIANKYACQHLTASEVLKWEDISNKENKLVRNLGSTQKRLIQNLEALIHNTNTLLLDGHYCLLNSKNKPEKIPEETFKNINPIVMAIVIEDTNIIYERLKQRDGTKYSLSLLKEMQEMEINYASHLSLKYNKPYIEIYNGNYKDLNDYLSI